MRTLDWVIKDLVSDLISARSESGERARSRRRLLGANMLVPKMLHEAFAARFLRRV